MKPHRQSEYMVGHKTPPAFEGSARFALMAGAAVILAIIALNKFFPEPAPVECAQVAAQK